MPRGNLRNPSNDFSAYLYVKPWWTLTTWWSSCSLQVYTRVHWRHLKRMFLWTMRSCFCRLLEFEKTLSQCLHLIGCREFLNSIPTFELCKVFSFCSAILWSRLSPPVVEHLSPIFPPDVLSSSKRTRWLFDGLNCTEFASRATEECCVRTCLFKFDVQEKFLPQCLHLTELVAAPGHSCCARSRSKAKISRQTSHRSPRCTIRSCRWRLTLHVNFLPQPVQSYRTPPWDTSWCRLRLLPLLKVLPHAWQINLERLRFTERSERCMWLRFPASRFILDALRTPNVLSFERLIFSITSSMCRAFFRTLCLFAPLFTLAGFSVSIEQKQAFLRYKKIQYRYRHSRQRGEPRSHFQF